MATDLLGFTQQEALNKVLNTDNNSLQVDIVDATGVTITTSDVSVYVDDATWTDDESSHTLLGGVYQASPQTITDGKTGPLQVDADGALHISDGGNTITVDGTVSVSGLLSDGHAVTIDNASSNEVYVRGSGTAGSADTAVLTVQGIASGVAQPISGTVTANAGTNLNTSALSTHAKQDTMITHLGEIEGAVETIETAVGTDGSTGPVGALSVGGTESGGNIQELRVDSDGHLQVDVLSAASTAVTNAGTFAVQSTLAASDGTDIGDVDVASIVPGYGATNLGKREDDAHSNLDTGVMALAVRNDAIAAIGAADGDYAPLQVNSAGSLYTKDETGEAGSILVKGTNAVAAGISGTVFIAIQFLEDTVFHDDDGLVASSTQLYPDDAGVGSDISSNGGNTDDVVFPQGMTIFGRWAGFKLASGTVIAYVGYV